MHEVRLVTGLWLTLELLFHFHPCRPKPTAFWWDRDRVLHPARSSGGWGRREVIVPSPTSSAGVETVYWASLPFPNLTEIGWRPPNYLENDRCDPLFSLVIFFQSGKKFKLVPSVYPSAWWSTKAVLSSKSHGQLGVPGFTADWQNLQKPRKLINISFLI